MNSYLSLIPISAKVHRRQNRMTILCIVISVLLVTAIFTIADMAIRAETAFMQSKHGNWHFQLKGISPDTADEMESYPGVTVIGWSEKFNFDAEEPYFIGEKKAALYGMDEAYLVRICNGLDEGTFPQNDNEVVLSGNAKIALSISLGERITIHTPAGDREVTVSGFGSDDSKYFQGQIYMVAVIMTRNAFASLMAENGIESNPVCYIQFQSAAKAAKAITELKRQYDLPDNVISENTGVMGIAGQSASSSMQTFYVIAAILFVLVLMAGVLMIAGSMNSNVAQRTQFFGMMRCIGASRRQVVRFVRLEALNWCKTAVPVGVILGTGISCAICAALRYGIGGEFSMMPVFAISPIGLSSGVLVGIVTVLLAAQSPAKRAAKVSPVAAISGNTESNAHQRRGARVGSRMIEWSLGAYHATSSKKSWFMMTASFALSIILFLCFSVGMDFARSLLPSLRPWQPDLTLCGYSNALVLDRGWLDEINAMPGVAHTFGISYLHEIGTKSHENGIEKISVASYDNFMLESSEDSVVQGSLSSIHGDSRQVATIQGSDNSLRMGDTVQINGETLEITCVLSDGLFREEQIVICSQETFDRLLGQKDYGLIGVILDQSAPDQTVQAISNYAADDIIFADERETNQENRATFLATRILGYGFLAIIAMITLFNIINSISMSVTARVKQYGAMRAVGMDGSQLIRMITAESMTYSISGLIVGCGAGLILSRYLHVKLLTNYFGIPWRLPIALIIVIIIFVVLSTTIAVYAPAKRMRNMAITETINEL